DAVPAVVAAQQRHRVADLALDRDVGHQALAGFHIGARLVAAVRIAIRVAVRDVEEENDVVAAAGVKVRGGHAASPSTGVSVDVSSGSGGRSVFAFSWAAAIRSARIAARWW